MYKSGASYSHIVNTSLAIEAYCAFLRRPLKLGRPGKPRRLVRDTLSEAEVTLIIHATRTLRERAIIVVLAYAGLRNRELCQLRISDVNLSGGYLLVRGTKPKKDRHAHIAAPCAALLAEYMVERAGDRDEPLFCHSTRRGGLFAARPAQIDPHHCQASGLRKEGLPSSPPALPGH